MEIRYTGHGQWCHPETCSCRPYSLFAGDKVVATYYAESEALMAKTSILEFFAEQARAGKKAKKHGK